MISELSDFVTAIAAIGTVLIARTGLQTWQSQKIGTRKIEVAEEICSEVDRFIKIAIDSTHMYSSNSEINEIIRVQYRGIDTEFTRLSASYYKPIYRINLEREFIDRLFDRSHIAYIYFGDAGERLIIECKNIQNEIFHASDWLARAALSGTSDQVRTDEPELAFIVNMGSSPSSRLYAKCANLRTRCRTFFEAILESDFNRRQIVNRFSWRDFLWG